MRQLQADLNESTARFQRDMADVRLLLESVQMENVDLKRLLEEKKQWIDVLQEEKNSCDCQSRVPEAPSTERESIGFSLLSIEVVFHSLRFAGSVGCLGLHSF